ncbi:D-glycerate dehydrogenase [Staphylococcus simiae]|uniref:2-hydroxyacid dehydrogenase n=1 Tax=Staphylococcus simiae TaxID=308354 RepID=UPI001A97912B|nr:D-glycerate dehydrogenase [Staphylococcus simiae]MBO1199395.1 D-glycerate dehydrogenase [Staphylococcus simiae]MBO1201696.1 D-glycerate dehydrogenase [Staphylococcus simiae]MBO1203878.1 D-glycerate dehydrogenase [Staphylococcus simiae]MBO1211377.1 D-glycerate dehydrogenase [Staphylococcus simiae]MBO1230077.1 D-glycerate dehydrogenase [Staphylococcus simiae]
MVKILVSRAIPERFYQQLNQLGEVEMWPEILIPMSREQFIKGLQSADACFITLSEQIDKNVLEQAQNLKIIANMAVGYDNIDIEQAAKYGVIVTNTPDVLTETTAELGFTLMLAVARRIVESEKYIANNQWQSWSPYLLAGKDVFNSTVGIFGMGEIGQAFARRLQGFNTSIIYHNRSRNIEAEQQLNATYVSFEDLLKRSDFIICTAPLTNDTKHRFNSQAFKQMKDDAIFINIGRGPIVDEDALVSALQNNEILGCGLDVLTHEPIDNTHPLMHFDNVIVTPHIGSASLQTRDNMIQLCIDNIKAVLELQPAITPVK